MVLAAEIKRLSLDIWHVEPGGHDSGTICGYPPHSIKVIPWLVRHAHHLHIRWWWYLKPKRWITDRCDDCGRRFLWRDARHGYQSSDKVYHDVCMSLRHVRGQLDDLTAYVQFTADDNAKFRAQYRLDKLAAVGTEGGGGHE
jgi:hypothetical protein